MDDEYLEPIGSDRTRFLEPIQPGRMRWWVLSLRVLLVALVLAVVRLRSLPSATRPVPTTTIVGTAS